MREGSIDLDIKVRDFRFSDEVLLRGTFKPKTNWTKVQFQHFITLLGHNLISINERKIRYHFRLIMRPDLGEINFDGEFILESPNQNKIEFLIQNAPQPLRKVVDLFILKNSYYHAEEFAKRERFMFPSAKEILIRYGIK